MIQNFITLRVIIMIDHLKIGLLIKVIFRQHSYQVFWQICSK